MTELFVIWIAIYGVSHPYPSNQALDNFPMEQNECEAIARKMERIYTANGRMKIVAFCLPEDVEADVPSRSGR